MVGVSNGEGELLGNGVFVGGGGSKELVACGGKPVIVGQKVGEALGVSVNVCVGVLDGTGVSVIMAVSAWCVWKFMVLAIALAVERTISWSLSPQDVVTNMKIMMRVKKYRFL